MDETNVVIKETGDATFNEEEKDIVENIGRENPDYCVFGVLKHRYPDITIDYTDGSNKALINGEELSFNFEVLNDLEENKAQFDRQHVDFFAEAVEMIVELLKAAEVELK